jgi:hypothetical protein
MALLQVQSDPRVLIMDSVIYSKHIFVLDGSVAAVGNGTIALPQLEPN